MIHVPRETADAMPSGSPAVDILVVDDSPADSSAIAQLFAEEGYRVRVALGGERALEAATLARPDLILLDALMPDMDGFQVCRQLRSDPGTRSVPVIYLSGLDSTDDKVRGFEAGGDDYVTKPFQAAEVLARVRTHLARRRAEADLAEANRRLQAQVAEIEALQAELREQAVRDSLTGLFNRRFLTESLGRELSRARREAHPIGLLILDVDGFKELNDRFGHAAGDQVLQRLGELLRARSRHEDVACRYGGDEFVVVLPGASIKATLRRAEQWRAAFAASRVLADGFPVSATLSGGVAEYPGNGVGAEEVLAVADKALYRAKASGRDRVLGPE